MTSSPLRRHHPLRFGEGSMGLGGGDGALGS
jgi:hypothetical protein